eukprot:CAMPEP_0168346818 /NCGR_PEP_ID=MMETSP0213-20121227/18551_1 /TAXON_ID=151035 /ORGANISM="Euplotes harpa, Strain FSP1.4" /LENGTH=164 /DNA_ID=CAMNT_0008355649 /DNA_START=16 /DNA_END=510 /DNA_ORIENTATION=+
MNFETKPQSLPKTLLQVAFGVALVDLFLIRALIGRVFFDPSNFIADLIYAYLFLVAYVGLYLATGLKVGSWLVQYLTSAAEQLLQINGMIMVVFYLMGQGPDVIGFLFNVLLYFSVPFGLLAYAFDYDIEHESEGSKQQMVAVDEHSLRYFPVESQKAQPVAMI